VLYTIFSAWVGFDYIRGGGPAGGGLLLFYWTLNLPIHGQAIVGFIQQYPLMRNSLLRILEPLEAAEENEDRPEVNQGLGKKPVQTTRIEKAEFATKTGPLIQTEPNPEPALVTGVKIEMRQVSLVAGGHTILEDVDISLAAGEHLAVVGPSGAGKSSLVGILLGWHKPASGECRVDGKTLDGETLIQMRRETAWVDPEVQIWNKTLLENLTYGNDLSGSGKHGLLLEDADLYSLLERLDNGLQTKLGEGGGLVSGGEGQRVRLARAMNRDGVRLVILDEPFRGLDRAQRRRLLIKARQFWKDATLICVTHDVGETQDFNRVLVIENGHVIEDAAPGELIKRPGSRYADLLKAEEQVRTGMWASADWRHLRMEEGRLAEKS
jgi:ATP-binding cassette subfamily B protein